MARGYFNTDTQRRHFLLPSGSFTLDPGEATFLDADPGPVAYLAPTPDPEKAPAKAKAAEGDSK
jgi:hypothetical protein